MAYSKEISLLFREVACSNLGSHTDHRDRRLSWFSSLTPGKCCETLKSGHGLFLPYPFQFLTLTSHNFRKPFHRTGRLCCYLKLRTPTLAASKRSSPRPASYSSKITFTHPYLPSGRKVTHIWGWFNETHGNFWRLSQISPPISKRSTCNIVISFKKLGHDGFTASARAVFQHRT